MPPSKGRGRNVCVWFISFFFFLILLAGGGFLVLYITLPESKDTIWFPVAGMLLVGIPWIFWFMTCIYRSITARGADRPPFKAAGVGSASGGASAHKAAAAATCDSPVDSPGAAAKKVRFGNATVTGTENDAGGSSGGTAGTNGMSPGGEADGDAHAIDASNDGSSLNSHESEVPLALSMS